MKLYLTFAILFIFFFSSAFGFHEYLESKEPIPYHEDHHHCMNKKGYKTAFALTSFNSYFPTGDGYKTMSFQEFGYTSVDFEHRRMMVRYYVRASDGVFNGTIWAFNETQTFYILSEGECKKLPLTWVVPSGPPINQTHYAGHTRIGKFPVIMFRVDASVSENLVNQTFTYDPKGCSPVSSFSKNLDPNEPGYSLMEFYEYHNHYDSKAFDLPSECSSLVDQEINVSHNQHHSNKQQKQQQQEKKHILPHILSSTPFL